MVHQAPFKIDWTSILQFLLYCILSTPPNYLWYALLLIRDPLHYLKRQDQAHTRNTRQVFLENTFPSTYLSPTTSAISAAATNDEKELDKEQSSHEILEAKLNIRNTITKFLLDQSISAAFNTLGFSLIFAGFKGASTTQAIQIARQDFWSLMRAGWRLWPAVSLLNYTFLKTVEARNLVGGLASLCWNIYLCSIAGSE